jgi:hypothetical protein
MDSSERPLTEDQLDEALETANEALALGFPATATVQRSLVAEIRRQRCQLAEAVDLLDNARCDLNDPDLWRKWGQRRKVLRARAS